MQLIAKLAELIDFCGWRLGVDFKVVRVDLKVVRLISLQHVTGMHTIEKNHPVVLFNLYCSAHSAWYFFASGGA